jgi:hypothetical protein
MARKKVSTTVYITPEQAAALAGLSHATRVPASEYIRQGIDLILAANGAAPHMAQPRSEVEEGAE